MCYLRGHKFLWVLSGQGPTERSVPWFYLGGISASLFLGLGVAYWFLQAWGSGRSHAAKEKREG